MKREQHEHEEIERLLSEVLQALSASASTSTPQLAPIVNQFDRFRDALSRHMTWEERTLFPALERRHPDFAPGPGRVLRRAHGRIRRLVATATRGIRLTAGHAALARANDALLEALRVMRVHERMEASYLLLYA